MRSKVLEGQCRMQGSERRQAGERKLVAIGDYTEITEAERLGPFATRWTRPPPSCGEHVMWSFVTSYDSRPVGGREADGDITTFTLHLHLPLSNTNARVMSS